MSQDAARTLETILQSPKHRPYAYATRTACRRISPRCVERAEEEFENPADFTGTIQIDLNEPDLNVRLLQAVLDL